MMADIQVKIAGANVGHKHDLTITDALGDLSSATFTILVAEDTITASGLPYAVGNAVTAIETPTGESAVTRFSGVITHITYTWRTNGGVVYMESRVTARSNGVKLQRGRAHPARRWTNTVAGTILKNLVDDYLDGAFTYTGVDDGPTLSEVYVSEDMTLWEAFDHVTALAASVGSRYYWYIDATDDVTFKRESDLPAADWSFSNSSSPVSSFTLEQSDHEYANLVIIRGRDIDAGETIERISRPYEQTDYESFFRVLSVQDAARWTDTTAGVVIDAATTYGQRGVDVIEDSSHNYIVDWIWEYNNKMIKRTNDVTDSNGNDVLYLQMNGARNMTILVYDAKGIAANGVFANTLEAGSAASAGELVTLGRGHLATHSQRSASSIAFEVPVYKTTIYSNLTVGTVQTNTRSAWGLSGDWLITSITRKEAAGTGKFVISVRAEQWKRPTNRRVAAEIKNKQAATKVDSNADIVAILATGETIGVTHTVTVTQA